MATGINTKWVQERYEKMSNQELIQTVTQDAAGLTPEALEIVKAELKRRNLSHSLADALDVQNKTYTIQEIDKYCDAIRELDCPICNTSTSKLNATLTAEVVSIIVVTNFTKKIRIGCPGCLDNANTAAAAKSAVLGWWGFPWGIIRTIQAIVINLKNRKSNHMDTPNDYLRSFALSRIGELEAYKGDKAKLRRVIENGL
ncbi:hypothetical protein GFS24_10030 [Chitinophaga sp. SYP-B3965]|uniref:hypothetical protein n=1 Tax=Chitinophaga sp. SYP-B3965 TaxID=2663120 RepID=UPI00129A0111|nr:hypothetical protein [Chitinophaga sp. SYP-B3965]MRG45454.1 hypothetical protein [Chitinophaga sp. SYP-B3965]